MMTDTEILEKVRMIKDYKQAVKQFQDELKAAENQLRDMMEEKEYQSTALTFSQSTTQTLKLNVSTARLLRKHTKTSMNSI